MTSPARPWPAGTRWWRGDRRPPRRSPRCPRALTTSYRCSASAPGGDRTPVVSVPDVDVCPGRVVLGEQLGHQLAPARDAYLGEDRLEVVTDGVWGEEPLGGDLLVGQPARHGSGDLLLTRGEAVGLDDDRCDLRGLRRLDGERRGSRTTVRAAQARRVHRQPPAGGQPQTRG